MAKHPELVDKFIVMNSPHSKSVLLLSESGTTFCAFTVIIKTPVIYQGVRKVLPKELRAISEVVGECIIMPYLHVFSVFVMYAYCYYVYHSSQYMFMFQVPKLPELLLGMRDYLSIQEVFTGKVVVS